MFQFQRMSIKLLSVSLLIMTLSTQAKAKSCKEKFRDLKSNILASYLIEGGKFGPADKHFSIGCDFKEGLMLRASEFGLEQVKYECVPYEMNPSERANYESLVQSARHEPINTADPLTDDLYIISTVLYPGGKDELILQSLSGSFAFDSILREGPASEELIGLIRKMCAFAK